MYDLAIIGGGPAGYSAAFEAVKYDKRVVLFEYDKMGGTCLNRGCVPTKYLNHISKQLEFMRNSEKYGFSLNNLSLDYLQTWNCMQDKINQLRKNLISSLELSKIDIIYDKAKLIDNHTIVCNNKEYKSHNILVCTGSKPKNLFIESENIINSDKLLNIKKIPKSLTILGGGVIAVEYANIFAELGSKVVICIRGNRILRGWDKEIAVGLTQLLKKKGVIIKNNCTKEDMCNEHAEFIFSAFGRDPNIEGLNTNLNFQMDNGIVVDDNGMTSIDNIYAAGDVTSNSTQLAHVAMNQAEQIIKRMFSQNKCEKNSVITKCIYVGIEIASVGYTLEEAKERGLNVISTKQVMGSNARTLIVDGSRGFIKLIIDVDNDILVGAHLMCERAGDIVSELSLAINEKITIDRLLQNIRSHPSFCEEVTGALKKTKNKK